MEKVFDKKFDDLKVYIGSEMDRYLGLQRDAFRDDLRIVSDSVIALTERVDKIDDKLERIEMKVGKVEKIVDKLNDKFDNLESKTLDHEEILVNHNRDIKKLKVAHI